MTGQPAFAERREPQCAFCAGALASDDSIACIKIASHSQGHRFFGVHVTCLKKALPPEFGDRIDLADVPGGLDHFLLVRA